MIDIGVEFEKQASALLTRLAALRQWQAALSATGEEHRAFIIELAGMPKAGKSSLIRTLRHYFLHGPKLVSPVNVKTTDIASGYKVHTPAEGVSLRTPTYLKSNLMDYNVWAGAYALQELLEARHDQFHDLVILDRGPWDAGCWLRGLLDGERKKKTPEIEKSISFFQDRHWMTQADLHIVLTVDPHKSADRERHDRLIEHKGPASDINLMTAMRNIYTNGFKELQRIKAAECEHVGNMAATLIDTTDLHPKELAIRVLMQVFDVLDAKVAVHTPFAKVLEESLRARFAPQTKGMRRNQRNQVDMALGESAARVSLLSGALRREFQSEIDLLVPFADGDFFNRMPRKDGATDIVQGLRKIVDRLEGRK